jgi:hypothetical protein
MKSKEIRFTTLEIQEINVSSFQVHRESRKKYILTELYRFDAMVLFGILSDVKGTRHEAIRRLSFISTHSKYDRDRWTSRSLATSLYEIQEFIEYVLHTENLHAKCKVVCCNVHQFLEHDPSVWRYTNEMTLTCHLKKR